MADVPDMTSSARPISPTSTGRSRRLAAAVLVALSAAFLIVSLSGTGSTTAAGGRLGGDFPEFYGAGKIVREGNSADLYDAQRQAESQRGLFGDDDGIYLDFAYPPVVAAVFAPLSALPYRVAYVVNVVCMVGFLVLGLRLARPMVASLQTHFLLVLTGAVAFYPMFRAIGGGQNTAFTVLCFLGAWRARHDGNELLAGLWLGALLYKPQLAVIVLVAQLVSRRWRVVLGAAMSAILLWIASALTMGPGWVGPFLDHGRSVPANDGLVGGGGSVSLVGTAHRIGGALEPALFVIAAVLSVTVAVVCLLAWRRCERDGPRSVGIAHAVVAAGTVIAAPHVIFYDAGLLVVVGLVALADPVGSTARWLVGAVVVSALGAMDSLAVHPLLPLSVAAFLWALSWVRALPPSTEPLVGARDGTPVPPGSP